MTRRTAALAAVVLVPGFAAFMGGWASITVENLPDYLVAGRPTNVTFSVRQHGFTLLSKLSPSIEATNGSDEVRARAVATNREGYYTATVNVPSAGDWSLNIRSSFGNSDVKLLPIRAYAAGVRPAVAMSQPDLGKRLFVAKGCVTCHTHAAVGSGRVEVGPNLTDNRLPAEYLRRFLADPSVKTNWRSDARMPNLNLKPAEIKALIAFVTGHNSAVDSKTQ